jgi:hypothetical protein
MGSVTLEEQVDAAVDRWHKDSETKLNLAEYLGMDEEQYAAWVETGKLPVSYTAPPKPRP